MKKLRNVIIRNLTDEQREDLLLVMQETDNRNASQALLDACRGYARMVRIYRRERQEVEKLRKENTRLRKGLEEIVSIQDRLSRSLEKD